MLNHMNENLLSVDSAQLTVYFSSGLLMCLSFFNCDIFTSYIWLNLLWSLHHVLFSCTVKSINIVRMLSIKIKRIAQENKCHRHKYFCNMKNTCYASVYIYIFDLHVVVNCMDHLLFLKDVVSLSSLATDFWCILLFFDDNRNLSVKF